MVPDILVAGVVVQQGWPDRPFIEVKGADDRSQVIAVRVGGEGADGGHGDLSRAPVLAPSTASSSGLI